MARFTCPFCIREYDKSEVLYVCPESNCGRVTSPKTFEKQPIKYGKPHDDFVKLGEMYKNGITELSSASRVLVYNFTIRLDAAQNII
jgi:hypothetical protein